MRVTEAQPEWANSAAVRKGERPGPGLCSALLCLWLFAGCGSEHPESALPSGHWLYGDARAISDILESLEELHETPAARFAARLRERLVDCDGFLAHAAGDASQAWLDEVHCAATRQVPESLVALRAEGDLAFVYELEPGRQVSGRLERMSTGAISIIASLDVPTETSLAGLLIPGEEPAGAPALSAAETLVHARLRPASGLNVAALVSENSQADQMFRLRSELFLGQVLDGTWEVAIYMPREGRVTPPVALALDYSLRPAAKAAMEQFVAELEATWPIHHSEHSQQLQPVAGVPNEERRAEGACFHDLRLLPDLTPCYVVTDRSIVLGWNAQSLALALDSSAELTSFEGGGGLVVHLDRLPEADRRLQQQLGGREVMAKFDYVWDQLRIDGSNDGKRLEVRIRLEPAGAS